MSTTKTFPAETAQRSTGTRLFLGASFDDVISMPHLTKITLMATSLSNLHSVRLFYGRSARSGISLTFGVYRQLVLTIAKRLRLHAGCDRSLLEKLSHGAWISCRNKFRGWGVTPTSRLV